MSGRSVFLARNGERESAEDFLFTADGLAAMTGGVSRPVSPRDAVEAAVKYGHIQPIEVLITTMGDPDGIAHRAQRFQK